MCEDDLLDLYRDQFTAVAEEVDRRIELREHVRRLDLHRYIPINQSIKVKGAGPDLGGVAERFFKTLTRFISELYQEGEPQHSFAYSGT